MPRTQLYAQQSDRRIGFIKRADAFNADVVLAYPASAKQPGGTLIALFGVYFHLID
ncbi:hypothetical protein D3C87_2027500 [compost metagenome]